MTDTPRPPPGPGTGTLVGPGPGQPTAEPDAAPPAVAIVVDPRDDYQHTRAALDAHDLAAGRVTVHPTAGARGLLALAHDLLAALGKKPFVGWEKRDIPRVWRQAAAWICGYQITDVTVLRAHLLDRVALARLFQLAADTGAALTLVWHADPPADWRRVLPAAPLAVLPQIQDAFELARHRRAHRAPPAPQPMYCRPTRPHPGCRDVAEALAQPLPRLLHLELPRFRAELFRRLPQEEFARVDTLYAAGMDSACAFLTNHPGYRPEGEGDHWPGHGHGAATGQRRRPAQAAATTAGLATGDGTGSPAPEAGTPAPRPYPRLWSAVDGLAQYLLALVMTCPSPDHSIALLRGAQAGFLRHGLLLTVPPDPGAEPGPGFFDTPFTAQVADRIRAVVADPVCAAGLAVQVMTGAAPRTLGAVRLDELADDASTLLVRTGVRREEGVVFPVPGCARDLLEAARAYARLDGAQPFDPLLKQGIGLRGDLLWDAAFACGWELVEPPWPESSTAGWYLRGNVHWVADPPHPNLHTAPGGQQGSYVPHT